MGEEKGDEIELENPQSEKPLMDKPFNPKDIEIKTKQLTIDLLIKRMSANPMEIDLYPDFQRKSDLWNDKKQSQLIESILISFPLPAFYFDGTDDSKWLVIDGLQRLTSLKNFIIDKRLKLNGLEFLKKLEGKGFDELERTLQRKIEETQIVAYITNPGTPPDVMFNIFKRINTGGLILEPQEIRHALNQGIPAKLLAELAEFESFKRATGYGIPTERMVDREFITRFLSFYLTSIKKYEPDLDSFLNKNLAKLNKLNDNEINQIKIDFDRSMNAAFSIFEDWAFRRADKYPEKRSKINKSLFEIWSVILSKLTEKELEKIIMYKKETMDLFSNLCKEDERFINCITNATGDKSRVEYRFERVESIMGRILEL